MKLVVFGKVHDLMYVESCTAQELEVLKRLCTGKVPGYMRGNNGWNGDVTMMWFIDGVWFLPANFINRIKKASEPDPKTLTLGFPLEIIGEENTWDESITLEGTQEFVESTKPPFDDVNDHTNLLYSMLRHKRGSYNIPTGFGKTYLCYLMSNYVKTNVGGQTLIVVPRTTLAQQLSGDFQSYFETGKAKFAETIVNEENENIENDDEPLKVYAVYGGAKNSIKIEDADVIVGTYQSLSNWPEDLFQKVSCFISDEGHMSKAKSITDLVKCCKNAQFTFAISGTMMYLQGLDLMTVECYLGPLREVIQARTMIDKGRLPDIVMQPVKLRHTKYREIYEALLRSNDLPLPATGMTPERASAYRRVEFQFLMHADTLINFLKDLIKVYTEQGKNFLLIMKNVDPVLNVYHKCLESGIDAYCIAGFTPTSERNRIKQEIETGTGKVLIATDGTMAMGVSINNLHVCALCMCGHSAHVALQGIGRMLRNHKDKDSQTVIFDIHNDLSKLSIATKFDSNDYYRRRAHYLNEKHPVNKTIVRER